MQGEDIFSLPVGNIESGDGVGACGLHEDRCMIPGQTIRTWLIPGIER